MKNFKPIIETWKIIKNYNKYLVSDLGRIKRNYKSSELILKPQLSNAGYLRVQLSRDDKYIKYSVHRLVLMTFKPTQIKLETNHINGNKTDNRLSNLEWVTPSQNIKHAYKNKLRTAVTGENCSWAKLKEQDVKSIRFAFKSGFWNMRQLAELYKVNKTTIFEIIHYEIWRNVC